MNILSVPRVVGRGKRDAVREGMLVALARVLSPPQPELQSFNPTSSLVSAPAQNPGPHWPQTGGKADRGHSQLQIKEI